MHASKHRFPWTRRPGRPDRRRARAAVGWLVLVFVASQITLAAMLERGTAGLRDPEYYAKLARLRARHAEHPARPLLVAFGSSRVGMGLRPGALADDPAEPLVFNFGIIGSGPAMQWLMLERLLRDSVRPDAVLLEFWPPYFTEYAALREEDRLDADRLTAADLDLVAHLTPDPDQYPRQWRAARLSPTYSHRFVLLNRTVPTWVPWQRRCDVRWVALDDWGWQPSVHGPAQPEQRPLRVELARQYYTPCLEAGGPRELAVRAFAGLLETCRREDIPALITWLPESSEFRGLYPPEVECWATELFADFSARPGVRPINARRWVADEQVLDSFHLTPDGAAAFTARLRRELPPALTAAGLVR
jgi:hypothetical protein